MCNRHEAEAFKGCFREKDQKQMSLCPATVKIDRNNLKKMLETN